MYQELWVREQLRMLEEQRLARLPLHLQARVAPRPAERGPALGALARRAGRLLRRAGEGLEAWAAPSDADADIPAACTLCAQERAR